MDEDWTIHSRNVVLYTAHSHNSIGPSDAEEERLHADVRITALEDPDSGYAKKATILVTVSQGFGYVSAVYSEWTENIDDAKALVDGFLRFFQIHKIKEWTEYRSPIPEPDEGLPQQLEHQEPQPHE